MSDTPRTDAMQRIIFEGCECIVAAPEDIEALERELAEARDNDAYFCGVHAERARCIKAVVDEPEPDRPTPAVATITRAVKANILARINAQGGEVQSE